MKPECRYCHKPMQYNPAMSTETIQQFICHCQGYIYYVNVVRWLPPLEMRSSKNK